MKTIVLTTAIILATVLGINNSTYAASANDGKTYITLTEISQISKIEVHGNVQLYLSDGQSDQVKVYNSYYKENALVQDQNGTLCITSYKAEKLVVWVTVNDLHSLSVYDNAEVKSFGKLSGIELDVNLYNHASAQLNLDAFHADITLNGDAKANISGNIIEGQLKYNEASFLNTSNLASVSVVRKENDDNVKNSIADFVSL